MNKRVIPLLGALGLLSAGLVTDQQSATESREGLPPPLQDRLTATPMTPLLVGLSSPDLNPILSLQKLRPPAGAQQPYVEGQLMVLSAASASLDDIARDHGASVVRAAGPSGYGVLEAPAGLDALAFADVLAADPRVHSSARNGLIVGAKKDSNNGNGNGNSSSLQWHLDDIDLPSNTPDLSGVVVAVLDSGVSAVPSLADSERVAEWDFVNDDADASDDHQHGTHIASIIASSGDVQGVAPGVSLMPLKVLNHENQGYEADLVDAIYWAVDSGADVINMSLAFGDEYIPSAALIQALAHADEAGVVLVGAAGNAGIAEVSWPAASPDVIAVGATCADGSVTEYSNLGSAMDIMAPGGCIDQDVNGDGIPDGVIAESIGPQDPSSVGLWAMAGTSQAAAVVSGAVVHAIADGSRDVLDMRAQYSAASLSSIEPFIDGTGAGGLQVADLLNTNSSVNGHANQSYQVALMPYLLDNGDGTVTPAAAVTVLDQDLEPVEDIDVLANLHGASSGAVTCTTDDIDADVAGSGGHCVLRGPPVSATEDGEAAELAWRIAVDAVIRKGDVAHRPSVLMFGSAELDDIATAQNADAELREAMLALHWDAGDVPELGVLAESYAAVNSGAGLSTSPLGMLFNRQVMDAMVLSDASLDGTGLSASPLGLRLMSLSGSGLSTSPLMMLTLSASDSLNSVGMQTYSMLGSGLSTSPLMMSSGTIGGDDSLGGLQTLLNSGGWSSIDGDQAASLIAGSSAIVTLADAVGSGASQGAVEVSP